MSLTRTDLASITYYISARNHLDDLVILPFLFDDKTYSLV